MSRRRHDPRARPGSRSPSTRGMTLLMSALGGFITWVGLLSWRGFTRADGAFLVPLAVLAVVIVAVGAVARQLRLPAVAVVATQVVISVLAACALVTHLPLPIGAGRERLADAVSAALDSAARYASPVPADAPGIHPLLIAGGLGCLLGVDIIVCTLRRAPLAGLPLLIVYTIPITMVGTRSAMTWWMFSLVALGYLVLIFCHEREQIGRWGRALPGAPPRPGDSAAYLRGSRPVRGPLAALGIGGLATLLALAVPLSVPTLSLDLVAFGAGNGHGHQVTVVNPTVDLQRDLQQGADVPLLDVTTDDPDPSYLRIAVLTRFDEDQWTSGNRSIPSSNTADGSPLPPLQGVSPSTPEKTYDYTISMSDDFDSTWLPTMSPITSIDAQGDWRFDPATMDFIAASGDLTTEGETYTQTGVRLDLSAQRLERAPSIETGVSTQYTALPADVPDSVRDLADSVTAGQTSKFGDAVALQTWFRSTGHFTYSLKTDLGDGTDDLVHFLTQGPGGRIGYCQQFAAAMAVMARELGIPARVAVGFLQPDEKAPGVFEYSSHDMHAWPELYFPGSGWVRFEPTPAARATTVPTYTVGVTTPTPVTPSTQPHPTRSATPTGGPSGASAGPQDLKPHVGLNDTGNPKARTTRTAASGGFPWVPVGGGAALVLLLAGLTPGVVRRRRRALRLDAGPEEAWDELRDTTLDLGETWPTSRSPRETRERLVRLLGGSQAPTSSGVVPERPARGARVAPDAVWCLDRIVTALERSRYAAADSAASRTDLRADLERVVDSLAAGATARARRTARWWPRSVFVRSRRSSARRVTGLGLPGAPSGAVDRVG